MDEELASLVFLHAASSNAPRIPWQPLTPIGRYEVIYDDGGAADVPIEYGGNVAPASRPHALPMASPIYRHQGYIGTYLADPFLTAKDRRGGDVTLYGFEWVNPEPEKRIRSIRAEALDAGVQCALLFFAVTGVLPAEGSE